MTRLARLSALLGGVVLCILILLTCLSILGRSLNTVLHGGLQSVAPRLVEALLSTGVGPINGDFELVEAGMAFAIFSFLPLCQLNGSHASVDIFTAALPVRVNAILRMVIEVVFAAILVLIAWQLFQGMFSKYSSGQITLLLQFPVWWGYMVCLPGAALAAVISAYVAAMRLVGLATGRATLPPDLEAQH